MAESRSSAAQSLSHSSMILLIWTLRLKRANSFKQTLNGPSHAAVPDPASSHVCSGTAFRSSFIISHLIMWTLCSISNGFPAWRKIWWNNIKVSSPLRAVLYDQELLYLSDSFDVWLCVSNSNQLLLFSDIIDEVWSLSISHVDDS